MAKTTADIRSLARGHTRKALNVLASIMSAEDAPPAARVSAASALLDRGYGKPQQTIDSTNTNVNYSVSDQPVTEDEWQAEHVTEH